jgi:VIT1/CCC1 family predicted Fe2+/Mn2+ transporter
LRDEDGMNEKQIGDHLPKTWSGWARHYLRDLVYGANDGIITTFAVVAGVAGAGLEARTVVVLGIANLVADGFSMGASNFLAQRSENAARESEGRPVEEPFPARHGGATFLAFIVAGSVPLLAYIARIPAAFGVAIALTAVTQFTVGALRALVTPRSWWRAGLEMLTIGGIAAALAYFCGAGIERFVLR